MQYRGGCVFLLPLLLLCLAKGAAQPVPLELLTAPHARCLDGTQGGFYHQPALDPASSAKWVIHLQGGGECVTAPECMRHLFSPVGSSKFFPPFVNFSFDPDALPDTRLYDLGGVWHGARGRGGAYDASRGWATYGWWLLGDTNVTNPHLWGWNHVLVPYCSQDLHSGQRHVPVHVGELQGLYFSGHIIIQSIFEALDARGLVKAAEIILTGNSAGGMGTFLHADWVFDRYPNTRVIAAPIAGYYFYSWKYDGVDMDKDNCNDLSDFSPEAWPRTWALWDSFVDQSCALDLDEAPWDCMLANVSYSYIQAPLFITQAQTDMVVIQEHDCIPAPINWTAAGWTPAARKYVGDWHKNMTKSLSQASINKSKMDGVFSPACYIHTNFTSRHPLIKGFSFMDLLHKWMGGWWKNVLEDMCGELCNPTCN